MAKGEITAQEGSFPLTRGKRGLVQILSSPRRLIPAHAGKTMPPTASLEAHRAHPRSRGENVGDFASGPGGQGSSPLTRGKRANAHRGFLTVRLIPAHAGKTVCGFSPASPAPAHPRSRGENVVRENLCRNPSGSSPLTRGKPVRVGHAYWWSGLIPAHAGKTSSLTDRQTPRPAHPRSRGENRAAAEQAVRAVGSSPLTRGKRAVATTDEARNRLIPAHAGKTAVVDTLIADRAAHPRSRGENQHDGPVTVEAHGSSPLTRGKRCLVWSARFFDGLIPAHAGKTSGRLLRAVLGRAHPRSRGENARANGPACPRRGSSPLTRGKLGGDKLVGVLSRLIPAHAGKTQVPGRESRP